MAVFPTNIFFLSGFCLYNKRLLAFVCLLRLAYFCELLDRVWRCSH